MCKGQVSEKILHTRNCEWFRPMEMRTLTGSSPERLRVLDILEGRTEEGPLHPGSGIHPRQKLLGTIVKEGTC